MVKRISLIINFFLTGFFIWYFVFHIGLDSYYFKYVSPRENFLNDMYYRSRIELYSHLNRVSQDHDITLLVGDSIAEQFPINEMFTHQNVVNRGIGNDTTVGLLQRIEQNINNLNVKNCILLIGHNDIKYRSSKETVKNIIEIINRVNAEQKYVISILPTESSKENKKICEINNNLLCIQEKIGFTFVDCFELFTNTSGMYNSDLFYDKVHPNYRGYLILANRVVDVMKNRATIH